MSSYRPRIRHETDLERAWRVLAPPDGPRPHAFWIMLIGGDHRALTRVVQVEEAFAVPPPDRLHVFSGFLTELVDLAADPVERVAFLRTRPGHFGPTDDDIAWAACLQAVASGAGLACETVFLGTDLVLVPVPREVVPVLASA
jgi:hypothetical protein